MGKTREAGDNGRGAQSVPRVETLRIDVAVVRPGSTPLPELSGFARHLEVQMDQRAARGLRYAMSGLWFGGPLRIGKRTAVNEVFGAIADAAEHNPKSDISDKHRP